MSEPILQVEGLTSGYGKIIAIRDLSFSVAEGDVVGLLGSNGAGKTTALRTITGLLPVHAGRVKFEGADITTMSAHERARKGLVMVPEGRGLFDDMTVRENLLLGAHLHRRDRQWLRDGLSEVTDLFPILGERMSQRVSQMSGGQQQMVAIGRGLMSKPRVLILDEPSLGLAPVVVTEVFTAIAQLQERGMTVLLVEQHLEQAKRIVSRAHLMEKGTVVREGSVADVLAERGRLA